MTETISAKNPMLRVLSLRDFRLLFGGAATSLVGDQFAFIATPWLVLQLTGDPLALGIVLALEGLPRAIFMLIGGAITDRFSPRLIMIVADAIRLVLTALMALVIFTGAVQMWMLYVFGLGFGLVSGFAIPAENSIVPVLVKQEELQAGNSLMMGLVQLVQFVGPTIAGIVIGGYAHSLFGVGLAFALDAFSFGISAVCLWLIRGVSAPRRLEDAEPHESVWASILAGLKYVWDDQTLRLLFGVMLAVNFLVVGPLLVGIPVLANQRLPEGAVAFGLLMSAYAGGNLGGYIVAGMLPRPSGATIRVVLIVLLVSFGFVIAGLAFIQRTWVGFVMLLMMGLANGYTAIMLITWIQLRTPRDMLGRMMSLLMFGSSGLVPISQALSGALSKWNLNVLLVAAGALDVLVAGWTMFQPGLKALSEKMAADVPAEGGTPAGSPEG
jgi:MFS family permease